ncbi:stage II sporulation protein P [Moorella sulfitireducens (nom. illeg.)]|uniref:stage II sporulation protein P n=1 Tax=Neomoorella sulfitireducens TaxID=2972948 RepID=UPI0021ACB385
MKKAKRPRRFWLGILTVFTALALVTILALHESYREATTTVFNLKNLLASQAHTEGEYSILVDEQGRILDMMSRRVYLNDEFIAADNHRYKVIRIEGNRAICREIGIEQLSLDKSTLSPDATAPVQARGSQVIGVYHSHDDESYVPTQGTESIPGSGGILQVGTSFANRLRSMGLTVIVDQTSHAPHDDAAYRRSRRTATGLLQKGAAAIFDLHRDGVPDPTFYRRTINGQNVTMIRLVVGRENQNMSANLDFAKRLKAAADTRYPGLIRGIFIGAGSYNQDLSPRAMLLEVGTHTNTLAEAEGGVTLFADIVPPVLGVAAQPAASRTTSTTADWKGVLFVILAVVLGGGAFLIISTGSWEKAVSRLKQVTSIEWVNLLGWRRAKRPLLPGLKEREAGSFKKKVRYDRKTAPESLPNEERADWQKD